jgi:hypothetical protein
VKLLRWPDFRVLGHDHDGFRLCSLLLKRACTVDECAMLLDLPAAAVRVSSMPPTCAATRSCRLRRRYADGAGRHRQRPAPAVAAPARSERNA